MSGEVPGASAGLHPFLPTSSPHLPKLFSEENLTLILFAYSFKMRVYHIHTVTALVRPCRESGITVMNFSFSPKDQLTHELTQAKNSSVRKSFSSSFFFEPLWAKRPLLVFFWSKYKFWMEIYGNSMYFGPIIHF